MASPTLTQRLWAPFRTWSETRAATRRQQWRTGVAAALDLTLSNPEEAWRQLRPWCRVLPGGPAGWAVQAEMVDRWARQPAPLVPATHRIARAMARWEPLSSKHMGQPPQAWMMAARAGNWTALDQWSRMSARPDTAWLHQMPTGTDALQQWALGVADRMQGRTTTDPVTQAGWPTMKRIWDRLSQATRANPWALDTLERLRGMPLCHLLVRGVDWRWINRLVEEEGPSWFLSVRFYPHTKIDNRPILDGLLEHASVDAIAWFMARRQSFFHFDPVHLPALLARPEVWVRALQATDWLRLKQAQWRYAWEDLGRDVRENLLTGWAHRPTEEPTVTELIQALGNEAHWLSVSRDLAARRQAVLDVRAALDAVPEGTPAPAARLRV